MEEIELSEQCRLGNNRARKELYEQYAGRMLGICLRYTGDRDTAQDLLHDGFLKIFDSFDKFIWRGEGSLRAWICLLYTSSGQMDKTVIDTAVCRVLRMKFEMGLFEHPYVDPKIAAKTVRRKEHIELARKICLLYTSLM